MATCTSVFIEYAITKSTYKGLVISFIRRQYVGILTLTLVPSNNNLMFERQSEIR